MISIIIYSITTVILYLFLYGTLSFLNKKYNNFFLEKILEIFDFLPKALGYIAGSISNLIFDIKIKLKNIDKEKELKEKYKYLKPKNEKKEKKKWK